MQGSNSIVLTGALTRDAELKYAPTGLAVLTLDLGGIQSVEGRAVPFYQRVTVFGAYAEALVESLVAGVVLMVEGRLSFRKWEDPNGGGTRSAVDVIADRVINLVADESNLDRDQRGQPRLRGAINQVILAGNLTRDVRSSNTQSGDHVARAGLAVNDRYYNGKDTKETTHYFELEAWRKQADLLARMSKSTPVALIGRIKNSSFTDKDGNKRYSTEIEVFRLMEAAVAERQPVAAGARQNTQQTNQRSNQGRGRTQPATPAVTKPHLDIDEEFPPEEDLPF